MEALEGIGERVLEAAKAIAPLDTGRLIESGMVTRDEESVAISFDAAYAVVQHEREDFRHAPGRRAGFLREALEDAARGR